MEKNYGEKSISSYGKNSKDNPKIIEAEKRELSDFCDFELSLLAEKIKLRSYRPKPKMLFY